MHMNFADYISSLLEASDLPLPREYIREFKPGTEGYKRLEQELEALKKAYPKYVFTIETGMYDAGQNWKWTSIKMALGPGDMKSWAVSPAAQKEIILGDMEKAHAMITGKYKRGEPWKVRDARINPNERFDDNAGPYANELVKDTPIGQLRDNIRKSINAYGVYLPRCETSHVKDNTYRIRFFDPDPDTIEVIKRTQFDGGDILVLSQKEYTDVLIKVNIEEKSESK